MDVLGVGESQRGILLMDLLLEVRNRQMLLFEKGVVKVTGETLGFADRENRLKRCRTRPLQLHLAGSDPGKREKGKREREREKAKGTGEEGRGEIDLAGLIILDFGSERIEDVFVD